ncbi:MAG: hypothetical protein JWO82_2168 [Akkermansiaceae bacterium]|nr:hypothetical protein [Akkermansiaceae bacterium]
MNQEAQSKIDAALRDLCSGDIGPARTAARLPNKDVYLACALADLEGVDSFIREDAGWVTRTGGPNGWEPIQYACYSGWTLYRPELKGDLVEIVKLLLASGANPNACHVLPENGRWPQTLLYACSGILNHADLTELLLKAGADINEGLPEPDPNDPGKSPWGPEALYHATEFKDTACLELLLKAGPRRLYVSYCLARALDFENPAAIGLFLRYGADPDFQVPWAQNRAHLHRAIINGRSAEIAELLIKAGACLAARDKRGFTAYRYAVRYGRIEIQRLLESRGESDATASDRELGLLMQGISGVTPTEPIDPALANDAARRNDVRALTALAGAGGDLNALHGGMAPLHEAAWWGRLESVRFLIARGADLHASNSYGGDALSTAIHGSLNCFGGGAGPAAYLPEEAPAGDYPGIVELLVEAGAKVPAHGDGSPSVRLVLRRHLGALGSAE